MTPTEREQFEALMERVQDAGVSEAEKRQGMGQIAAIVARASERMQSGTVPSPPPSGPPVGLATPTPRPPFSVPTPVTPPSNAARPPDAAWKTTLAEFLNAPDWPARFAVLDDTPHNLLHDAAIAEVERTGNIYRQQGNAVITALMARSSTCPTSAATSASVCGGCSPRPTR